MERDDEAADEALRGRRAWALVAPQELLLARQARPERAAAHQVRGRTAEVAVPYRLRLRRAAAAVGGPAMRGCRWEPATRSGGRRVEGRLPLARVERQSRLGIHLVQTSPTQRFTRGVLLVGGETSPPPHEPPSPLNRDGVHHLVGAGKTVLARRAVLRKGVAFHFSLCRVPRN